MLLLVAVMIILIILMIIMIITSLFNVDNILLETNFQSDTINVVLPVVIAIAYEDYTQCRRFFISRETANRLDQITRLFTPFISSA